jgi:hypothetical protein
MRSAAQAGLGLLGCSGEPVHLGLGYQYFGLERRPGGRRNERRRLVQQGPRGGELWITA